VRVRAGEYNEQLTLKCGINLIGEGRDAVTVTVDANEGTPLRIEGCSDGLVEGITFRHTGLWIYGAMAHPPLVDIVGSSIELRHCNFFDSNNHGVLLTGGGRSAIRGCFAVANSGCGIFVSGTGTKADISNSMFSRNMDGIRFDADTGGSAVGNLCSDNNHDGISVGDRSSPEIVRNVCNDNGKYGIHFEKQSTATKVSENSGSGNRIAFLSREVDSEAQ